jgi:FMN phosphatase YigB (HAD superfamily)
MIFVALDIGNVLVYSRFKQFLEQLSKTLNITLEEAEYFMNRTQKLHDLGHTKMADELRDHFKIRSQITITELTDNWKQVIVPDINVIHMLNDISKKRDLRVALVSNVGLEHAEQMERILKDAAFYKNCVKFFSCHVGARKPSLLYYHLFLQLHPEWQHCIYVDDLQENLDASEQFKFTTFKFCLSESLSENKKNIKELKDKILDSDTNIFAKR